MVVDWNWTLCSLAFESVVVPLVIASLYKPKGRERNVRFKVINLLSVVGKIYAGILADKVFRVIEGLSDDEKEGLRVRRVCVDQIFTLKHIGEGKHERKGVECMCGLWIWRSHMIWLIGKLCGRCWECMM